MLHKTGYFFRFVALCFCSLFCASHLLCAQEADLSFSGGNGTPLTLTLNAPVTYVINTAAGVDTAPFFAFKGVGDMLHGGFQWVSGNISFTINAGAAQPISYANSGVAGGSVSASDVYLVGATPGVKPGDLITLSAGTLTTSMNVLAAPSAGGVYPTYLFTAAGGNTISTVPEPSTWAILVSGLLTLVCLQHVRRKTT